MIGELKRILPRSLGRNEILILILLKDYGRPFWDIAYEICGCRKNECLKEKEKNNCRVGVSTALKLLKKKELVYKKRYLGENHYYLTKKGKKLVMAFWPERF